MRASLPRLGRARVRVGWASTGTIEGWSRRFGSLPSATAMRVANIGRWIHGRDGFRCELYDPRRRYDIVVFVKTMGGHYEEEARRVQSYGGRVLFDANVNYYEIWGDYDIPGTKPTEQQQRDAIAITRLADGVVADSSYLLELVRKLNERAIWIPDNVDTRVYRGRREHVQGGPVRLVWSGVSKKAQPLIAIRDALASVPAAELVLVSDRMPEATQALERAIACRFVPFTDRDYARTLLECDVIVSPKRLVNGYEVGHTEYKIALGMAVGVPAVASPQQSYLEAIGHRGGGIVADGLDEWRDALQRLAGDAKLRADLGARAALTVSEHYSTPVVARRYFEFLRTFA